MSELKNQISQFIDTNAKIYQDISLAIHAKPEVSDFEYFASQTLSEQLKKEGFEIELPAAGHRTGFAATYKSNKPGPTVVFLAEYDEYIKLDRDKSTFKSHRDFSSEKEISFKHF